MTDPRAANQASAAATSVAADTPSILQQAISVTKQTDPDRLKQLLRTFADAAMGDTVTFDKNLTVTLRKAVEALDKKISSQLAAVMHDRRFLEIEGGWRGL